MTASRNVAGIQLQMVNDGNRCENGHTHPGPWTLDLGLRTLDSVLTYHLSARPKLAWEATRARLQVAIAAIAGGTVCARLGKPGSACAPRIRFAQGSYGEKRARRSGRKEVMHYWSFQVPASPVMLSLSFANDNRLPRRSQRSAVPHGGRCIGVLTEATRTSGVSGGFLATIRSHHDRSHYARGSTT